MWLLILLFQLYAGETVCVANLKYFETLSYVASTTKVKRSSDGTKQLMTYVTFKAFDRNFDLTLTPDTHLLAEGFTATVIHEDGSSSDFEIDQKTIFSGYLTENPDVRVYAHMEHVLWTIRVYEKDNIFLLEPAWRLLNEAENPSNDTMVVYKSSDLTASGSKFCGVEGQESVYMDNSWLNPSSYINVPSGAFLNESGDRGRGRRAQSKDATCMVFLVGDYSFFKRICDNVVFLCSSIMYSFIDFADVLYTKTIFDNGKSRFTNVGIKVVKIILYSSFTERHSTYRFVHFNENKEWTVYKKLDAFATFSTIMSLGKSYCVNHLLTDYPFPDRILGLAWMGSICAPTYPNLKKRNSGLTSGSDKIEGHVSTLQMNLVFAHEIGHNFGSEHDTRTKECSRPENEGGNFLMWPRSVSGKLENHNKFSPCSRRLIANVLAGVTCLRDRSSVATFCGNGAIDQKEECDGGIFGFVNNDSCCLNTCKLKPGALCSSMNYGCCENCTYAPKGKACYHRELQECRKASYCTGTGFKCPEPDNVENWKTCKDQGQCYRGICRGFCEVKSIREMRPLKGCLCQSNEEACKWCCYEERKLGKSGPCKAYSNETVHDGRPCYAGYCQLGVCQSDVQSTVQRIYSFLPSLRPSEIASFMKANIVLAVVVFSILLWLPPIYMINKMDNREKMEKKKRVMESLVRLNRSSFRPLSLVVDSHAKSATVDSVPELNLQLESDVDHIKKKKGFVAFANNDSMKYYDSESGSDSV